MARALKAMWPTIFFFLDGNQRCDQSIGPTKGFNERCLAGLAEGHSTICRVASKCLGVSPRIVIIRFDRPVTAS